MHEMTSWTRLVWETVLTMLEEGTQACSITDNPMTIDCEGILDAPLGRREALEDKRKRRSETYSR